MATPADDSTVIMNRPGTKPTPTNQLQALATLASERPAQNAKPAVAIVGAAVAGAALAGGVAYGASEFDTNGDVLDAAVMDEIAPAGTDQNGDPAADRPVDAAFADGPGTRPGSDSLIAGNNEPTDPNEMVSPGSGPGLEPEPALPGSGPIANVQPTNGPEPTQDFGVGPTYQDTNQLPPNDTPEINKIPQSDQNVPHDQSDNTDNGDDDSGGMDPAIGAALGGLAGGVAGGVLTNIFGKKDGDENKPKPQPTPESGPTPPVSGPGSAPVEEPELPVGETPAPDNEPESVPSSESTAEPILNHNEEPPMPGDGPVAEPTNSTDQSAVDPTAPVADQPAETTPGNGAEPTTPVDVITVKETDPVLNTDPVTSPTDEPAVEPTQTDPVVADAGSETQPVDVVDAEVIADPVADQLPTEPIVDLMLRWSRKRLRPMWNPRLSRCRNPWPR